MIKNLNDILKITDIDLAMKEISVMVNYLHMNPDKISEFNTELNKIGTYKIPYIILICILRNTFSMRHNISNWIILLDHTVEIIKSSDKNYKVLLHGLLNNETQR